MAFNRGYRIIIMASGANSSQASKRRNTAYAYLFDGFTSSIQFPHTSPLNFINTDAWTFEAWVKLPTLSAKIKYLYHKYDTVLDRGIRIRTTTANRLNIIIANGASNKIDIVTKVVTATANYSPPYDDIFPANKWLHVVVTYSGSGLAAGVKVYFDGREYAGKTVTTNNLSATTANTENILLGSDFTTEFSDHFQGLTRMFNAEKSAATILGLYNKGVPKFTHGLVGCVLEMKVKDDVYSSNWTVLETANSNTGVSVNMNNTQKVQVTDMDGMQDQAVQNYTGNSIYYETFGKAGRESTAAVMHSPCSARVYTPIFYDATTGNTYISWHQSPKLGYNRTSRLLCIMHLAKTVTPSVYANYLIPGITETHSHPSVCVAPNGDIILAHEEAHNSPIYIEKTAGKSLGSLSPVYTITGYHSYPTLSVLGSNIFLWVRGANVDGNGVFEDAVLYKSTDNGSTWSELKVLNTNSDAAFWERPYCILIHHPSKLCYMICRRDDNTGKFISLYYLESTDGIAFSNVGGSFTKNVSSAGFITRAELDTNFLAFNNGGSDILCKAPVITATGMIVGIVNYGTTEYKVLYYSGGTWQTKALDIPTFIAAGHTNDYRADFFGIYSYSDTRFIFWRVETRSTYKVVVQYETTDFFTTLDAGTIVSATNLNHEQLEITNNIYGASKVVITANQLGVTYNKLFIYEFTP